MRKFTAGFFLALLLASAIALVGQSSVYNLGPIQFQYDGSHVIATTPIVAKFDATAQQANIAATPIYAVGANTAGMYRVTCVQTLTQAATTSSQLPNCSVGWTDETGSTHGCTAYSFTMNGANTANGVGALWFGSIVINAAAAQTLTVCTGSYLSTGATPMQYAVHFKLEYLGN